MLYVAHNLGKYQYVETYYIIDEFSIKPVISQHLTLPHHNFHILGSKEAPIPLGYGRNCDQYKIVENNLMFRKSSTYILCVAGESQLTNRM